MKKGRRGAKSFLKGCFAFIKTRCCMRYNVQLLTNFINVAMNFAKMWYSLGPLHTLVGEFLCSLVI